MTKQEVAAILDAALGQCDDLTIDRCMLVLGAIERGIACSSGYVIRYWPEKIVIADIFPALRVKVGV